jgi:hypothetical protein
VVLTFDPQLKKILTFSVKDRYQLNYFICIKDLNTETITSLKWNLFSFFIGCCQHYETKTIFLYIFLISDRCCGTEHQYLFSRFLGVSIFTAGNRHKQNSWFCKELPVLVEESSRRRFARYVHVKKLKVSFYCSNIAKSENAMLWRMLSRLETYIVYSCIWSVTLAKSIVPRKTWRKLWHSYISKLF